MAFLLFWFVLSLIFLSLGVSVAPAIFYGLLVCAIITSLKS